jgi:hypothetical protein
MKNTIKTIFLFVLIVTDIHSIKSQCLNDASTNPSNPINNEMKDGNGNPLNGHTVNEFVNRFNWGSHTGSSWNGIPVVSSGLNWSFTPGNPMFSPFSTQMPSEYSYLHQNGALPINCDWHWEDGWELMWMNLGYYPNLENISTPNPNRINPAATSLANPKTPYFFLYNRYTGKLRHFGNLYGDLSNTIGQQVITTLKHVRQSFNTPVSGVFRHLGSYDRALDLPTLHDYMSSNNPYPGNNNTWFSSDFQLGFDPCVCEQPTLWQLDYQSINSWNVNLQGRSVSTTMPVNEFDEDYLTNTSIQRDWNKGGGSILYKKLGNMYDDYENEMAEYSKKLANYNKPQNQIARELVSLSKTLLVNGTLGALVPTKGAKEFVAKYMKKIDGYFDAGNADKMAAGIRSTSESLLGKGFDFLSQQLIGSDFTKAPVKPTMPTATFSEMVINGTIDQDNISSISNLYNPGSFNPAVNQIGAFNYPYWNKPVGLFALLRTPSVQVGQKGVYAKSNFWVRNIGSFGNWSNWQNLIYAETRSRSATYDVVHTQRFKQDIYFKLKDKLLYRFNHNVDFDFAKTKTMVTFEIEFESDCPDQLYYDNPQFGSDKSHKVDLSNSNLSVLSHFVKTNTSNEKLVLTTDWEEITNSAEQLFGGQMVVDAQFRTFSGIATERETKTFLPPPFNKTSEISYENTYSLGVFDLENNLFDMTAQMKYNIKKIKMKLMPQMVFKQLGSNGGKISTTQVFTYLIYDKEGGVDLIEAKGAWVSENNLSTLVKYQPGTLTINNEEIKTSSPYVTSVSGNIIHVNAENIQLTGDITVQSGYEAHLTAYRDIETLPNCSISPACVLNVNSSFYGIGSTTEATDGQVSSFCKGINKEYAADQASRITPSDNNPEDTLNDYSNKKNAAVIQIVVQPNPADQMAEFNCFSSEDGNYLITVSDLSGRQMTSASVNVINGKSAFSVNTSNFSSGLYFVTLSGTNKRVTQKLLVRH